MLLLLAVTLPSFTLMQKQDKHEMSCFSPPNDSHSTAIHSLLFIHLFVCILTATHEQTPMFPLFQVSIIWETLYVAMLQNTAL